MRIKAVNELSGGEVLAEPVLTEEKIILIPKGSILKEEYLPLIQSLGIDTLMVQDPYEGYENPTTVIEQTSLKKLIDRVRQLMESHIYHNNRSLREFEVIANEIVKEVGKIPEESIFDVDGRLPDLYEHTVMVTLLCVIVARQLKLDKTRQYNIALGGLLHDLGIRYITTPYVNRNWENENPVEIFEYKKHTILGYSALDEESWIPESSKKMVLFHHERLDGSGFPMRRRDFDIECRIIQACDAFECYITGMECVRISLQETFRKMQEDSGKKFDAKVVNTLLSKIAYYPVGTKVKMNDNREGIVVSQTEDAKHPIVLLLDQEHSGKKYNLMLQKDISILQII